MGAGFDRDGFVDDVAFDLSGRCQANLQATYFADNMAVYDDIVSDNFAFDYSGFANSQQVSTDVAFDLAFDLDVAARAQIALDDQVR